MIGILFHYSRRYLFYGFVPNAFVSVTGLVMMVDKMDAAGLWVAEQAVDNKEQYHKLYMIFKL